MEIIQVLAVPVLMILIFGMVYAITRTIDRPNCTGQCQQGRKECDCDANQKR